MISGYCHPQTARLDDGIFKYIGPRHLPFTGSVVGAVAAKGKTKASVIVSKYTYTDYKQTKVAFVHPVFFL